MAMPLANSASTRLRTRSWTSWMPSGPTGGWGCRGARPRARAGGGGGAAQAAERVLDLVGEVADQLAAGLLLADQALLARLAQLLFDRAQLRAPRGVPG